MRVALNFKKNTRFIIGGLLIMCIASPVFASADSTSPYSIQIPKKFGKVQERYRGNNGKVVIHIQDAHTSYEAQENIANLIEHLVTQDVIDVVNVEGAEGAIDVTPFREFPVDEIRWKAAQNMTAYGYLTGSELAAIGMKESVELFGVENMPVYDKNLEKFQMVMSKREDILGEIQKIEEILGALKAPLYGEGLKTFDRAVEAYYAEETDFIGFTKTAINAALTCGIDLYEFLNVSLFMESLQEATVNDEDKEVCDRERTSLIVALMKVAKSEKLINLLRTLEEKTNTISQEKQLLLDSFLVKQLRSYRLNADQYPMFVKQAQFAEKFGQVDKGALLDELDVLAYRVQQNLAGNNAEVLEHLALSHNLRLMKNLIELKVVPSQVDEYHDNMGAFSSAQYLNFLRPQTRDHGIRFHPSSNITLIDKVMDIAGEFYRFAEARSNIIVKNTMNRMNDSDENVSVLVAGGYHTEGMMEAFKKKGYSYLVVAPRIEHMDMTVPYMERMMNVKSVAEMRFESAFNTLVKKLLVGTVDGDTSMIKVLLQLNQLGSFGLIDKKQDYSILYRERFAEFKNAIEKLFAEKIQALGTLEESYFVLSDDEKELYLMFANSEDAVRFYVNIDENINKDDLFAGNLITKTEAQKNITPDAKKHNFHDLIQIADEKISREVRLKDITDAESYEKGWAGMISVVLDDLKGDAQNLIDRIIASLTALRNDSSVAYRQARTTTVVIETGLIKALGRQNNTKEEKQLTAGAMALAEMIDKKEYAKNPDVNVIVKSYLGDDALAEGASIQIICTQQEKDVLSGILKNAKFVVMDDVQGRKGKALQLADVLQQDDYKRDNVSIGVHDSLRKTLKGVKNTNVLYFDDQSLDQEKLGINVINALKAPSGILKTILKLINMEDGIFKQVADSLNKAFDEYDRGKSTVTSV